MMIHFKHFNHFLSILCLVLILGSCGLKEEVVLIDEDEEIYSHLLLGNPSDAVEDFLQPDNFLIRLPQYAASYDNERGIPNWVSWHLSQDWIGRVARSNVFRPNPKLPSDWDAVRSSDYTGSGFDRGHVCPSGDRTNSVLSNEATFLMTNIIPQAPNHNQELWNTLESYCRELVFQGNELYIIMGAYGEGGEGREGFTDKIGRGRVTVPKYIWKVIVVLRDLENSDDLTRINEDTRVITLLTENVNQDLLPWGDYRVSLEALETATDYDFLSELPSNVQSAIESKVDDGPTN